MISMATLGGALCSTMCWANKPGKKFLYFLLCWVPIVYVSAETQRPSNFSGQAQLKMTDGAIYRVKLLADATAVFYENDKHKVGESEFVSLFQVLPSNTARPAGLCGAGSEVWLYVYQITGADLVEKTTVLVSSCLRSISMASQNTGTPLQDFDFSSVQWNSSGFSIEWFEKVYATGRTLQLSKFVLQDGVFLPQDVLSQETSS